MCRRFYVAEIQQFLNLYLPSSFFPKFPLQPFLKGFALFQTSSGQGLGPAAAQFLLHQKNGVVFYQNAGYPDLKIVIHVVILSFGVQ